MRGSIGASKGAQGNQSQAGQQSIMSNQQGSPMVNQNMQPGWQQPVGQTQQGWAKQPNQNQSQNWQNQPQQQWVNQGQSMPVRPTIQSGIFCQGCRIGVDPGWRFCPICGTQNR